MRTARFALLCLSLTLVMVACQGAPYKLAQVSIDTSQYDNKGEAEIKTTGLHLFGLIPINLTNKIERAVNAGIASKGGDQMVNIEVQESWFWAYVLNGYQVRVKGTVLKKKAR